MKVRIQFYPSHLTKGMIAMGIALGFAALAGREFSLVGTEQYPEVPPQIQA